MIGVIAESEEADVVREFFELFKTPWEFYRRGRRYDVVLCSRDEQIDDTGKLVLFYAGKKTRFDEQQNTPTSSPNRQGCVLLHRRDRIPIYGDTLAFAEKSNALLTFEDSRECAAYLARSGDTVLARIGYDLFAEVRTLLTVGQPSANANMPALDLHIAFLRDLLTACGIPLVEIPPVPDGYQFVACLTHDVDHPALRRHNWDHTVFGFLYRAVFGSVLRLIRGQMSIHDLLRNWAAAATLPFVQLGMAKDFWAEFGDRYLEMEKGVHSTFFVVPFSGRPGRAFHGLAPTIRATRYGAHDIAGTIRKLIASGCEVGLHGIDAWLDDSSGRQELDEIRQLTGFSEIGVRMHWLYFGESSPLTLEAAAVAYDSTIGYNDTVGYRAGTTQVYRPLDVSHLLELPLHVMDTALFYPNHLALSSQQAKTLLGPMLDNVSQYGGVLTINWHDRSLFPERLWGEFYGVLIEELKNRGAWFATAGQATSWFRKRRAAGFEADLREPEAVRAKVAVDGSDGLPGLRLRVHKMRRSNPAGAHATVDVIDQTLESGVVSETGR
jgi:peptidoglycan/xylan/chitin deacetylase (PgdA/CDA1 family)